MKLKCNHVSASEAGDEVFQVLFEVQPEQEDSPYLLISKAFVEEDEGEPSVVYVEAHEERLTGHYEKIKAKLQRSSFTLRLPPPLDEIIRVDFTIPERNYKEMRRILRIIFQENIG